MSMKLNKYFDLLEHVMTCQSLKRDEIEVRTGRTYVDIGKVKMVHDLIDDIAK